MRKIQKAKAIVHPAALLQGVGARVTHPNGRPRAAIIVKTTVPEKSRPVDRRVAVDLPEKTRASRPAALGTKSTRAAGPHTNADTSRARAVIRIRGRGHGPGGRGLDRSPCRTTVLPSDVGQGLGEGVRDRPVTRVLKERAHGLRRDQGKRGRGRDPGVVITHLRDRTSRRIIDAIGIVKSPHRIAVKTKKI